MSWERKEQTPEEIIDKLIIETSRLPNGKERDDRATLLRYINRMQSLIGHRLNKKGQTQFEIWYTEIQAVGPDRFTQEEWEKLTPILDGIDNTIFGTDKPSI